MIYGNQLIQLSGLLTENIGRSRSEKRIKYCLRIAETIEEEQIVYAVRRQLSWTHIRTISYEDNLLPLTRRFYFETAINKQWIVCTLN